MSELTAPAAKVGWVKKQGRSGIYKNWKKRYFVLKKGCISYYEEADKPETLKVREGCIDRCLIHCIPPINELVDDSSCVRARVFNFHYVRVICTWPRPR